MCADDDQRACAAVLWSVCSAGLLSTAYCLPQYVSDAFTPGLVSMRWKKPSGRTAGLQARLGRAREHGVCALHCISQQQSCTRPALQARICSRRDAVCGSLAQSWTRSNATATAVQDWPVDGGPSSGRVQVYRMALIWHEMRRRGCCYSRSASLCRDSTLRPIIAHQAASPPHSHHSSLIEHSLPRPYYYTTAAPRREPQSRLLRAAPAASSPESAPSLPHHTLLPCLGHP